MEPVPGGGAMTEFTKRDEAGSQPISRRFLENECTYSEHQCEYSHWVFKCGEIYLYVTEMREDDPDCFTYRIDCDPKYEIPELRCRWELQTLVLALSGFRK